MNRDNGFQCKCSKGFYKEEDGHDECLGKMSLDLDDYFDKLLSANTLNCTVVVVVVMVMVLVTIMVMVMVM